MKLIYVSQFTAVTYSVISACGVVFLLVLGALYQAGAEQLIHGKDPIDNKAVARGCFIAAFLYIISFAFFYWQMWLIGRQAVAPRYGRI